MMWVNPSHPAYDSDPRWGIFLNSATGAQHPLSLAATGGIGGFSGGVRYIQHEDGRDDWTIDLGTAIPLPKRIAVGTAMHWHLEDGDDNYVAFDAAASWRPLPWLGIGAVTRNIGNPGGSGRSLPQSGFGLALRPYGNVVTLGGEFLYTFSSGEMPSSVFGATARVRPTRGVYLRARFDSTMSLGGGIEVYFGGPGFGAHAGTRSFEGVPDVSVWVGSDEPGESVFAARRHVSSLVLDQVPAYQPAPRLLARADPSWLDTLERLREVSEDRAVRGLVVTLGDAPLPWARASEIRDRITHAQSAGKKVLVYLRGAPSNTAYYAASGADQVLLHPVSTLDLTGVSAQLIHLHGLLDAVGVDVQVVRRSEYKAAAESFSETSPSPENLEQQEQLLDDLHSELVDTIAAGRGRPRADVEAWIEGGPWTAAEAVAKGIVDGRAYADQLEARLETLHDKVVQVRDLGEAPRPHSPWDAPVAIAVIYVEGPILPGESSAGGLMSGQSTGSTTVRRQLTEAGKDSRVRAVVLRVDSPGGSQFASDEIWRAVAQVQAANKPVVVSMGEVAASGGYYISAGADAIFAEPGTVTGSIGVISFKLSTARLMDWLGVRTTTLARGRSAGLASPFLPWDAAQRARVEAIVAAGYATFIERVSNGRGLEPEAVERIARGRIWSGRRAKDLGLVDAIGGLPAAIGRARELAGIKPKAPVTYVSYRKDGFEDAFDLLGGLVQARRSALRFAALDPGSPLSLVRGTPLEGYMAALGLSAARGERVWMLDPTWLELGPR